MGGYLKILIGGVHLELIIFVHHHGVGGERLKDFEFTFNLKNLSCDLKLNNKYKEVWVYDVIVKGSPFFFSSRSLASRSLGIRML